ncbi:hypothetical protein C8J57DRAFT_1305646 [Mycena rebaudengoi]|nr:hypothetical protein C8J57DRAFT_1305646 [Mycena rebaudengoi]
MHPRAASGQVALAAASTTIFAYHVLQSFYSTKRQRAWIITGLSSCAMTAASVPFVLDIIMSRGDVTALLPRPHLSPLICQIFQGFLIADLLVGSRHYPDQLTFCWGWIHHTMYILLMQYTIRRGWTHVFCLCAVMELPTSHLAISFLHPRFRNDWLFCAFFFATRIIAHIFIFLAFCSSGLSPVYGGNRLPAIFLAIAFPGHLVWFIQSVRGAIRRSRKRSRPSVTLKPAPLLKSEG